MAARAVSYLTQFVWGSRDDPYPEVNVNAMRVIVQNKRKLETNTKDLLKKYIYIYVFIHI